MTTPPKPDAKAAEKLAEALKLEKVEADHPQGQERFDALVKRAGKPKT